MVNKLLNVLGLSQPKLADKPSAETTVVTYVKQEEIGSPGVKSFAGYPEEEYLTSLHGRARADEFDKMRRSDTQVKMCLTAVSSPIKAGAWQIEKACALDMPDQELAQKQADLIEQILFKDLSRNSWLTDALTLCIYGHAVFEKTHKPVLDHPRFGSYNSLKSLMLISARTIERFNLNPETQTLESITQLAIGDLQKYVDIPAQYLIVMSLDKEGANFEGMSLLRPCYGSWMRKNVYQKINAIGIERNALGTPIGKYPAGQQNTTAFTAFMNALKNYTTHQQAFITIPSGGEWDIVVEHNTYDPEKTEKSIDAEDKRMAKAFVANFLELGLSGSGSFALGTDMSDFFLGGITHIANLICDSLNRELIPELIKLNFGPQPAYPQLKCSGIDDKAGKELADILGTLVDKKIIKPDDKLEENARQRFGLPAADPATARDVTPAPAYPKFSDQPQTKLGERIWRTLKLQESKKHV
jgi:hypothetical protein